MLLLVILALLFLVRLPCLVAAGPDGSPVLCLPLYGGQGFSLYYVHSVQRTPVRENFLPGPGDQLLLTSVVYHSLGVGLPFLPGEGSLTNREGQFVLTGMNRLFPEVSLGVEPVARQAIIHRDRQYDLNSLFAAGSVIRLRIVRLSPAAVLRQRLANGRELFD
ncbi:MAG: DUF1850 domain-containing protein [Peptococcaceae bacterium]|nr:DUF1850 domain-containing protein [Peptococcaceae bacterium]